MLSQEALQKIMNQFDAAELEQRSIFGISQYGGGPDESFIEANEEGLQLFALELLKSSSAMAAALADKRNTLPFHYEGDWIDEDSTTFIRYIRYIERAPEARKRVPQKESRNTFREKLASYGLGMILIFLALSTLIGMGTICLWLF